MADSLGRRTSVSDVGGQLSPSSVPRVVSRQHVAALVDDIARILSSFDDPTREARELVAALLDVPRHWPLFHENRWVEADVWQRAHAAADRRRRGAPLAYAVRRANFRSLTLDVDERVLIPRPETEQLIDHVLERCTGGTVVDVGTGSGAIAISLAVEGEGRFARVVATDISSDAIDVARANASRYGANIDFTRGSLLGDIGKMRREIDVVVSNPPYISLDEASELPGSVRDWEPAIALFSDKNGLSVTAQLVRQAGGRLSNGGLLALEVDSRRASLVAELMASDSRFENVTMKLDFAGRERFVLATRRSTND